MHDSLHVSIIMMIMIMLRASAEIGDSVMVLIAISSSDVVVHWLNNMFMLFGVLFASNNLGLVYNFVSILKITEILDNTMHL